MKGRDIIITGLQSLDSKIGSNCVNIAQEFARHNRVLYVNYALDRFTYLRNRNNPNVRKRINIIKGIEPDLVQAGDAIWNLYPKVMLESINQIGPSLIFDYLNRRNCIKFASAISSAVNTLKFNNFIIFNDSDFYRSFFLIEQLKPETFVYYTRDNMVATEYFRKHGAEYESRLMKKADLVVANSVYLQNQAKKFNTHSYYVGQGCDLELFSKDKIAGIPEDIAEIGHPQIGYLGALRSSRLDIKLLIDLAIVKPEWNIVLVGPEDDSFQSSELHEIPNVFFLGPKPVGELPAYINSFDVALNPQLFNELTIGNYPRKIDEYLALGKPVVATKTEAMDVFSDHVYLASGKDDYLEKIELALSENNKSREKDRSTFARSHTWENSVKKIYEAIEEVQSKK